MGCQRTSRAGSGRVALAVAEGRVALAGEEGPVEAAYSGIFHAVTSFNNAGISLYSDNMARFVADPVVVLSVPALRLLIASFSR